MAKAKWLRREKKRLLRKGVAAKKTRRLSVREPLSLMASADDIDESRLTIEQYLAIHRPLKKKITMFLDADVIEWFKKPGRRYQTRINRALREVMMEEMRVARKSQHG